MNVIPPQALDMRRHLQEDVEPLLGSHVAHIADKIGLAVLKRRVRGDRLKSIRVGAVAHNKHVVRSNATSARRKLLIAVVRGHDDIGKTVGQLLEPYLNSVEPVLSLVLPKIQLRVGLVMFEEKFDTQKL